MRKGRWPLATALFVSSSPALHNESSKRCVLRANDVAPAETVAIFVAMRPAFTLIELLVAIAVLTIGVLALAATAGMVASHVGDGGQLTSAAHAARSILDSLGAQDCAALTSGSITRGRAAVQWTVTRDSAAARIELTTGTDVRRGTRRDDYRVLVPCVRE